MGGEVIMTTQGKRQGDKTRRQQLEWEWSVRIKIEDRPALYQGLSTAERNRGLCGISWFIQQEPYDPQ